jgi:hypothetical protein
VGSGATALTVMPCWASSSAQVRVKLDIAKVYDRRRNALDGECFIGLIALLIPSTKVPGDKNGLRESTRVDLIFILGAGVAIGRTSLKAGNIDFNTAVNGRELSRFKIDLTAEALKTAFRGLTELSHLDQD